MLLHWGKCVTLDPGFAFCDNVSDNAIMVYCISGFVAHCDFWGPFSGKKACLVRREASKLIYLLKCIVKLCIESGCKRYSLP